MLIMSGSLMGIMPNVMFLLLVSYVHLTWRQRNMICEFSFKSYERLYLVDFVSLCHHDAVPLNNNRVGVNSALECGINYHLMASVSWDAGLTADWVLQSWPAMVRSSRKVSLLITSTLQVSDLPRA